MLAAGVRSLLLLKNKYGGPRSSTLLSSALSRCLCQCHLAQLLTTGVARARVRIREGGGHGRLLAVSGLFSSHQRTITSSSFSNYRRRGAHPTAIQDEIIALGDKNDIEGLLQLVDKKGEQLKLFNAITCLNR